MVWLLLVPIHIYRKLISPLFPARCRYTPSCSLYAIDALRRYGPLRGIWLSTYRLIRCNPYGGFGFDPVPDHFSFFYYKKNMWGAPIPIIDIHTHHVPLVQGTAIVSKGIHPWNIGEQWEETFRLYAKEAANELFIGESGLDKLRGADFALQKRVFEAHIRLSETLGKPLIVHCVHAMQETLEMRVILSASQPWIIHGFRGGPEQANQWRKAGCHVSFGLRFNHYALRDTPPDELFIESDEESITEVYRAISHCLNESTEILKQRVNDNILRLLRR